MSTRLTAYDHHGLKWTPDHTVRVTPRYETPGMFNDRRNRPIAYEVQDLRSETGITLRVPNLREAQLAADAILSAQPRLDWENWQRGATANTCAADSPAGRVEVRVPLKEDPSYPGMWRVSFNVGRHHFGWLSDIRYFRHRMANVRAAAEYRASQLAEKATA
jgi:hypothetical protein